MTLPASSSVIPSYPRHCTQEGTKQGKPFEYRVWYSDTYVRKAGGWRYVLGQAAQPLSP